MSERLSIGAIIIGDEILSGRRQDKHLAFLIECTQRRQLRLSFVHCLSDRPTDIEDMLRYCFRLNTPCFCFGGIGNTPDDHTRAAAARAAHVPLVPHPKAEAELATRFSQKQLTEPRRLFALLPENAEIILNPFNRIPGFKVHNISFLPGFPEMAHPMVLQELDRLYHDRFHPDHTQRLIRVSQAQESALLPLIGSIESEYPVTLSMLPSVSPPYVELGLHGTSSAVEAAYTTITERLNNAGYLYSLL